MSESEQDAALLRLVKQRKELKERKALVENELRSAGMSLTATGQTLLEASKASAQGRALLLREAADGIRRMPESWRLEHLLALIRDLEELEDQLAGLNAKSRELGLD